MAKRFLSPTPGGIQPKFEDYSFITRRAARNRGSLRNRDRLCLRIWPRVQSLDSRTAGRRVGRNAVCSGVLESDMPGSVGVNHIALAAEQPDELARFYQQALGLRKIREARDERGVHSVWLLLPGESVLMIERGARSRASHAGVDPRLAKFEEKPPGWLALCISIRAEERAQRRRQLAAGGARLEHESEYTLYFRDPEGNRFGLSSFDWRRFLDDERGRPV